MLVSDLDPTRLSHLDPSNTDEDQDRLDVSVLPIIRVVRTRGRLQDVQRIMRYVGYLPRKVEQATLLVVDHKRQGRYLRPHAQCPLRWLSLWHGGLTAGFPERHVVNHDLTHVKPRLASQIWSPPLHANDRGNDPEYNEDACVTTSSPRDTYTRSIISTTHI